MRGHIRKRGKASWSLVVPTGLAKPKQKWFTVKGTKKAAEAELARLLNEVTAGGFVASPNMRLDVYLDRWLADYARQNVSPKTFERYEQIIEGHIKPALGGVELSKLKPMAIQKFYGDSLATGRKDGKGGLSAQTVTHFHRILHKALKQAVEWELVSRNPADAVKPPRPERKSMQALDHRQTLELEHKLAGTNLLAPVLVAVTTGLRRGELLALKWPHVDLERGTIVVNSSLEQTRAGGVRFKEPKTKRSRRTVALMPYTVEVLRTHKAEQAERRLRLGPAYSNNELVFPRTDGRAWSPDTFSGDFEKFVQRSGLPRIRFHDLRHTHASQLLLAGIHPKVVSERLGHSSIGITMDTYSHVLPGMQEDAVMKIDGAMRAARRTAPES